MDPESKLGLALDVGNRTLAMAQRVIHQVAQVLAPACTPLFLTDGFRVYITALLSHYGHWVQPARRQATGSTPKSRWMPRPQRLYAQGVKTVRRQRLVDVQHRVVFGSLEAVNHVLTPLGWHITTRPSWSYSTSPSGSMWPRSGDGSARCVRAKTGCGSSWPCSTVTTISVCPMRAYADPCPSPSRLTAAAQPPSGGLVYRPWRWGSPTMSGRRVRCCSFASRRGHSQQGCEQALVVGSVRGGDLSGRCVSARPASRRSPGVRGLLGCHESSLVYAFLFL
jgi:hypothetical protein